MTGINTGLFLLLVQSAFNYMQSRSLVTCGLQQQAAKTRECFSATLAGDRGVYCERSSGDEEVVRVF